MTMIDRRKELNRQASREGINKETAAEYKNLARRYERLGKHEEAKKCLQKRDDVMAKYPHLFS